MNDNLRINTKGIEELKKESETQIARILDGLYEKTGLSPSLSFFYRVVDGKYDVHIRLELRER